MTKCRSIGCQLHNNGASDFCTVCQQNWRDYSGGGELPQIIHVLAREEETEDLSEKYPQYYKAVGKLKEVDVYAVHHLFDINDPSGAIQHASKKLLLSGARTGGKSAYDDIKEARDTLTRWLQLNAQKAAEKPDLRVSV